MTSDKITDGLLQLGFDSGWVISGEEIVLWENSAPQPTTEQILKASKDYIKPELSIADKLAAAGLSIAELKTALGL